MIFSYFKKFVRVNTKVEDYLENDLDNALSQLQQGLTSLTLADNMSGYFVTVTLIAGESASIANRMDTVPTGFLVIKQSGAGQITVPTDKTWTVDILWIKNNGGVSVTATIFFLR